MGQLYIVLPVGTTAGDRDNIEAAAAETVFRLVIDVGADIPAVMAVPRGDYEGVYMEPSPATSASLVAQLVESP